MTRGSHKDPVTPDEAFAEAEARIAQWQPGTPLDLAIAGLDRIPPNIDTLSGLAVLILFKFRNHLMFRCDVADLSPLTGLTNLQTVDCNGTEVADLSPLAELRNLQTVHCSFTQVTDLSPLAGLTKLQKVHCAGTKVIDLSPLARLRNLQTMDCTATKVTDLSPLAGLTSLQTVGCNGTEVADLSPLAGLRNLQTVDCARTEVTDLSPLAGLRNLQEVNCAETKVTDLAPLAGLHNLRTADFSHTAVADLSPLAGLRNLQTMDCTATKVTDLSPLAGLRILQTVHCGSTNVTDLSPLAGLHNLQTVNCRFTRAADLSPLAGLHNLQTVDCGGTEVADLLPLAGLTNLQTVHCAGTKVTDLSPLAGLSGLRLLELDFNEFGPVPDGFFESASLQTVTAEKTTIEGIISEVLSKKFGENCLPSIRAHLTDLAAGAELVRDAKVMVLGNGRVGKTQIRRRLKGEAFDPNSTSTHAIEIDPYLLTETPEGEPAHLNLWDFGGQDIYHATHVLFLRGRAIFLIVWTPEAETAGTHRHDGMEFRNRPLPFWIGQAKEFAGITAPLIVIQSQVDRLQDRADLPPAAAEMAADFKTRFDIQHSAKTGRGHADLEEALAEAYAGLDRPIIGKVRAAVKREVERMVRAGTPKTMTLADFRALCDREGGVADPDLFLDYLHNAGSVFWQRDTFDDALILDQNWAIAAIYSILDRKSRTYPAIENAGGQFTQALLNALLWGEAGFSDREQGLFLSMMLSCGICFQYRRAQPDRDLPAIYVAPDLLPTQPSGPLRPAEMAAVRQVRSYPHLPDTLIRGIVSAIGSQAGDSGTYWRTGLGVYEERYRSFGRIDAVTMAEGAGHLTLSTWEGDAHALLTMFGRVVEQEDARLGLRPTVEGPDAVRPTAEAPGRYADAVPSGARGRSGALAIEGDIAANRADAPAFTTPPKDRKDWFFSYANASEHAAEKPVEAFCEAVEAQHGIRIRRDVDELVYGEEIEPFMRELAGGDRIFVWLTDAYLKSPYCMFELHEIWRKSGEDGPAFDKRVTVIMGDAQIRLPSERQTYWNFWKTERDAVYARMLDVRDKESATKDFIEFSRFYTDSDPIIDYIQGRVRHRNFDELRKAELGEP